jgi:hypothetical protein
MFPPSQAGFLSASGNILGARAAMHQNARKPCPPSNPDHFKRG